MKATLGMALLVTLLAHPAFAVAIIEYQVPTPFSSPTHITAGPDGNLWFTEFSLSANKIGKATTSGVFTEYPVPTAASGVYGITSGPDGNIWFTEMGFPGKIGKVTTGGVFTEYPLPTPGSGPDYITAGPDGNLWFTESGFGANKIGKVTTSGVFTEYTVPTPFSVPVGITPGLDGNLWFTEQQSNKIGRITTSGVFTEYTAPPPPSNEPSNEVWEITAGPDGNLWFTETTGNKIGKITTTGTITEYVVPTAFSEPEGITAGPDGNLWFTEVGFSKIGKITTSGVFTEYSVPTSFSAPAGITAGPDGNLWFTEQSANQIGKLALHKAPKLSPLPATVKSCGIIALPGTYQLDPTFQALPDDVVTVPDHQDLSSHPGPPTACILIEASAAGATLDLNGVAMSGAVPGQREGIADLGVFDAASNVNIMDLCSSCAHAGLITGWRQGIALNESSTGSFIGVTGVGTGRGINVSGNVVGIEIFGASNVVGSDTITDNTSLGGGFGIYVVGGSAHDNRVLDNNITANGSSDIRVSGSNHNRIVGNLIDTTLAAESGDQSNVLITEASFNVLQRNTIIDNPFFYGISVYGGCCTTIGGASAALGNNITGNAGGIKIDHSNGSRIQSNFVQRNGFGLLISNSNSTLINHNDFSHNLGDGVQVAGSSDRITGNTVNNNGRRGIVIGNVCIPGRPGETGLSAGDNDIIGGHGSRANQAVSNGLIVDGNPVDYYWDGKGTGNVWPLDNATSGSFMAFPPAPATGPGSANFFIDDGTPPTMSC